MNAFGPASACGRGCLPRPRSVPQVALAVRVGRMAALVAMMAAGIGVAAVVPLLTGAGRGRTIQHWFRMVVRASGVRLEIGGPHGPARPALTGDSPAPAALTSDSRAPRALTGDSPALVAANHLSWMDIPALLAVEPMRVVAKAEVRGWPVLGMLAARGGTLFIDRYRLRRLPTTVAELAGVLRGGVTVLAFPEGTTRCGRAVGRVFRATLQSAIDAGVAVRPVRLQYRLADGTPTTAAAWVGDDTLFASIWRIVSTRGLVARVEVGASIPTAGRTRREVAANVAAHLRTPSTTATVSASSVPPATASASSVPPRP